MDIIIFILVGILIGGAIAFLICYSYERQDEKIKQEISDKLKSAIEDIKSTVYFVFLGISTFPNNKTGLSSVSFKTGTVITTQ